MERKFRFIVVPACIFLLSCNFGTVSRRLDEAEKLLSVNIKEANYLLDKIAYSEQLHGSENARYCYLKAICAYHQSHYQEADSLNRIAISFCKQTNDPMPLIGILSLQGVICLNSNKWDDALAYYSETNAIVTDMSDSVSMAFCCYRISQCYLEKKDYANAVLYAKNARTCIYKRNSQLWLECYKIIASGYSHLDLPDSALFYYQEGIETACRLNKCEPCIDLLCDEAARFLLEQGDYRKALEYNRLSMQNRASRGGAALFNLTKARIFMSVNEKDSAKHYLLCSIQSAENGDIAAMAYRLLADLYISDGDFKQGFYQAENAKKMFESRTGSIKTELLEQKFREAQLKNENSELKIKTKEREVLLLSFALTVCILTVTLWFFYSKEKKKKQLHEQRHREQLLVNQAHISEQKNRLLKQENELGMLRESLFKKMSVSKKIPSLETGDNQNLSSKRIQLDETDWKELMQTIDAIFNGFTTRLKHDFPDLQTNDIRFCSLLKINVSMQDLADIYCVSKAAVTKRKMRMKQDKFKLKNSGITLDDFLVTY